MITLPIKANLTVDTSQRAYSLTVQSNREVVNMSMGSTINATIIDIPEYTGDYTVTPLANSEVVLETEGKMCTDDITVKRIQTFSTHNESGITFYIAEH